MAFLPPQMRNETFSGSGYRKLAVWFGIFIFLVCAGMVYLAVRSVGP